MLNKITSTNSNNIAGLIARVAVAIAIFPHGAQKLLGWFGGAGFEGTQYFMTEIIGAPWILGLMVIIIEFFGSLLLFIGLFTRPAALLMIFNFIGVIIVDIWGNGFFMNWAGIEGRGEGYEYFVLLFGIMIISLIIGGGKASIDANISQNKNK